MSDLGELLALLHDAGRRSRTVRAVYRTWTHAQRAFEAQTEEFEEAEWHDEGLPVERTGTTRLWLERPDRVREETEETGEPQRLIVRVRDRKWTYDDDDGAVESGAEDGLQADLGGLMEPGRFLGELALEPTGRAERSGRPVLRALARPRSSGFDADWVLHDLGAGADEYELEVDAEWGVLLRVEARRRGEPFASVEALEIAYDEEIPEERFVFDVPPGVEVRRMEDQRQPVEVPLHEAAALVPFTIWIPARVPDDWSLSVHLEQPVGGPHDEAMVMLWYRARDASAALDITEHLGDALGFYSSEESGPMEEVEVTGLTALVRGRAERWPRAELSMVKDGTSIHMQSSSLELDELVQLAQSLMRAPTEPPLARD